jgi:hypothetical protein
MAKRPNRSNEFEQSYGDGGVVLALLLWLVFIVAAWVWSWRNDGE